MTDGPLPIARARAAPWRELARWAPVALAAAILIWHSLQYDFVTDDAFISFVFSRNLAEHGQLTFNLGDPVEGYTNFLWTFVLGILMLIGIPPELSARVLGTGFGIGVLILAFRIAERAIGERNPLAALVPLLLACSSGFACWSSGGLETQLYTFLIAVALDGIAAAADARTEPAVAARALRRMAIALALAAMTRPEALMIAAVFAVYRYLSTGLGEGRWRPDRAELRAAGWFLGLWAPWFAWRCWYYGWLFPNTAYVKAAGAAVPGYDAKMRAAGWHYVGRWAQQTGVWWTLPLIVAGLVSWPLRRARTAVAILAALVGPLYLAYAIRVGGDFMGLHRFIMPVFVLTALALALGLDNLARLIARASKLGGLIAGLAIAAIVLGLFAHRQLELTTKSLRFGNFANDRGIDTPAFLRVYTADRARIGKALAPCVRPDDYAIFGGVGALPYYARLRGIDVFGLVSSRVAHEVPRTNPRAGHNKWGPDPMMLEHHPTIVLSCYDLRRQPGVAPLSHCAGFWLAHGFERVVLHVPGLQERGEYLTFLARTDRALTCPGLAR